MRKSDMVSRGTQPVDAPRQRRDCQYPALAGSCPVCLGTLPCPCEQAYGAALYRCAGSACPGLPYRASDCSHPFACSTIADVRAITRDADAEIGRTYGDPATLGACADCPIGLNCLRAPACQADAELDAIEFAALEHVRDRDADKDSGRSALLGQQQSDLTATANVARGYENKRDGGERPALFVRSGTPISLEPFDGREPDKCAVCDGHGGELEPDQDGYCVGKWCRTCGGTGERKYCGECLDALPKGGEPEQKHEAVFELRVDAGVRDVTRLVCEEPGHLGCALRDVVDMARRVRAQHDEARAAEQRMRAAIEADASKEPLP